MLLSQDAHCLRMTIFRFSETEALCRQLRAAAATNHHLPPATPHSPPCGDGSGTLAGVGGDAFDLAEVGLSAAKYVRITDVDGDPEDPGDAFAGGFDLDAVAALHSGPPL
ncbi:MAG: hypothetical protein K8F62_06630 [Pseudorhodoplanes sp.]|nr:hypothetical protein [Pseudorhodoplanes sp.]